MSVSADNPIPISTPSPFRREMGNPDPSMAIMIQEPTVPTPDVTTPSSHHPDPDPETDGPLIATSEPSVEELKRQKEELDRQIAERQRVEKLAVIQQIMDVAKQYDVTIEDLVDAFGGFKPKRKGVKATPKYRDPDSGTTWSGRGKEPTWMRGRDREEFRIPDDENGED